MPEVAVSVWPEDVQQSAEQGPAVVAEDRGSILGDTAQEFLASFEPVTEREKRARRGGLEYGEPSCLFDIFMAFWGKMVNKFWRHREYPSANVLLRRLFDWPHDGFFYDEV
ncbi:hypothetical protein CIB48_g2374 [Xylaria polymorpha]|nr:hypothetical protein CIB48_g2374 [Xylaria polymorpha]